MRSLSDVSIHSRLILKNGNEIEIYLFSSCDNLSSFQGYLTIIIQVVVACQLIFFCQLLWDNADFIFSEYRYVNYAHVRLI